MIGSYGAREVEESTLNHGQVLLKSLIPLQGSTTEMLAPCVSYTGSDSHEAEAFLASLRIPVPKLSRSLGDDKKEDDFVIKFDEDSDSDGDHQNSLSSSSTQLGSNPEKITLGSVGVPNSTPLSQATSAGPNQKPSGLKSEIDRMKKQIAAMERSKAKPPVLPVIGKSPRAVAIDTVRPNVSTATDAKSLVQVGSGNLRSGPDLESLRLQIAAKESELQERRKRLAARGPEPSKVGSDLKEIAVGVSITSVPLLSRTNSSLNAGPAPVSTSTSAVEKISAENRKEVSLQADGLIALASTSPAGVGLAGHKKDVSSSGLDICADHHNVTDETCKLPSYRAGTLSNNFLGRQSTGKGMKRPHVGVESVQSTKVARVEGVLPLLDNQPGTMTSKGLGLSVNLPVKANGTCKSLPVQGTSQHKRKVDAIEMPCKVSVEVPGPSNSGGSDAPKKLKISAEAGQVEATRGERLPNLKHPGLVQSCQAPRAISSAGPVQALVVSEKVSPASTLSPTHTIGLIPVPDSTFRIAFSGEDVVRGEKPARDTEDGLANGWKDGGIAAGSVQNSEVPTLSQGLARIFVNEDDRRSKAQKPRFQYEGSHALAALAGVSVPDAGVTKPGAGTEPSAKKHDIVSSNERVREGMKVKTGMYLRPSSVLLTPEVHPAQSLGLGCSNADNWDIDPDSETFEQLQAQEELLDKELEEAQERRHHCELRERAARKEYRESQRALREVNAHCDLLNQRKEFLLSRIHLVEGRQYSRKFSTNREPLLISSVDNSSLRLTGPEVAPPCSMEKPPTSLEPCARYLPSYQPSTEPEPCGANGEENLTIQVAESIGPSSMKDAGLTTGLQRWRRDSVTSADEDDEHITGVVPSDGISQEAVVHVYDRDVVSRREPMESTYLEPRRSPLVVPQTESRDLRPVRATEVVAAPSGTRILVSEESEAKIPEGGKPDISAPGGQHVSVSCGEITAAGCDTDLNRVSARGKEVPAKCDASLSKHSEKQGYHTIATDCGLNAVSSWEVASRNKSHDYEETFNSAINFAAGVHHEDGDPGTSAAEILMDGLKNVLQDPCIVIGKMKQGSLPVASAADKDRDREFKSPAVEVVEVVSPVDGGVLRARGRSTHELGLSTCFEDRAFDVPELRSSDDGDGLEKDQGHGLKSCTGDVDHHSTSNSGKVMAVIEDGPVVDFLKAGTFSNQDSDKSEDLATKHQGLLSERILMNGVTGPDIDIGVKVSGGVADGGCLSVEHRLNLSRAASEEMKLSPTASVSESSREIFSEPRRGSCADSEDFSTCTDHVRPQGQSKTMSSNMLTEQGAMCQSSLSAGDTDAMEQYEETHSLEKLKTTKKVHDGSSLRIFGANSETDVRSCLSQPDSRPALETRQENLVGGIPSHDRQTLSAFETVHVTAEQYSLSLQSACRDKVSTVNDRCSPEFEDGIASLECDPPRRDPGLDQSFIAPFDPNLQRLNEDVRSDKESVIREGVEMVGPCSKDDDYSQKQSVALTGVDEGQTTVHGDSFARESADEVSPDIEAENNQPACRTLDALESKHSNLNRNIENSKRVEVEVFKKSSLEVNVRKRPSGDEKDVAKMGFRTPTDADKEQIIPPLQHHLLGQLLDLFGVRTHGEAGDEEYQGCKGPLIALPADNGVEEAQSSQVECPEPVAQSAVQSHKTLEEKTEVLSNAALRRLPHIPSEPWFPSAEAFDALRYIPRDIVSFADTPMFERTTSSGEKDLSSATVTPAVLPRYESPLAVFRSYRSFPQFADVTRLSSRSSTWSHAINPHKPLCRFEHRGQCRNNHCPWQHADDYTLSPSHVLSESANKESQKVVDFAENVDGSHSTWSKTGPSFGNIPSPQNPGAEGSGLLQESGCTVLVSPSNSAPRRKHHDYEISVPTYRIGHYTLKAEDPTGTRLGIPGIQRKGRTEIYNSFLLSSSIHRILPSDSPCLLDNEKSRFSVIEASDASELPNWRYIGSPQEERVFKSSSRQGSKDVEMWLELALNHIDFDIACEKPKARDEALCILSRGLETKQNSVTLWMAYSCLFHTRRDNPESDDMFQYAIQYIPGSYELWLLYINSRPELSSRMEAYEKAIVALVENGNQSELLKEDTSACLLDIALQMLYCMCVSGSMQDALTWVDDLIHDASTGVQKVFRRGSTSSLLSYLTPHDACILWVSCTYLSACGELPVVITRRLGCKHELSYTLSWSKGASSEKVKCARVMKTLSTAASSGRGCLSLEDPHPSMFDCNNRSKQMLGVNYVQCLAIYEGLDSAARLGKHLIDLYPTSVELVLVCARIEERRAGSDAGLKVFEEAVSCWPDDQPGIQRLWNQYAVHGWLRGGSTSVSKVLSKSIPSRIHHPIARTEDPYSRNQTCESNDSTGRIGVRTGSRLQDESSDIWSHLREHYHSLLFISGSSEGSTFAQARYDEDSVYGLINLALVEALSGDRAGSLSAINKAMRYAGLERDLKQCWKELACLQVLSADVKEQNLLRLLDRCKTESCMLSQLKPLSFKVLEELKRPHVRKFFVDLLGPLPTDPSLLNCILEIWYGPSLLPSEVLHTKKDVFHFAEGILEAVPGNVEVALSLCKMVIQEGGSSISKSLSSAMWASALLISSLQQSSPVAPEVYWVEAGVLLRHVTRDECLEEYYLHALVKYPFSVALRHGLEEVRLQMQESGVGRAGTHQADMVRDSAGPIDV
ncbi:hypothetical protein MPTK1_2g02780 [Marchantia polymorpha subsp. ruderalis]|uniref:C3H1-type domain-containing protein n=1 Tax=Marchantia polymorpha TaxID=3197 RepID=A0A2R6WM43_MARPO|nr:hypothetical protein MARPO_0075s0039 [Marchantia polymorpha]PTQ34919.1 hypothetical protein MARPO_0075s0039 [Marchantia polymorpha]BBN00864.1 hypothetical protein Mp_2g02780 [Marchantia polymorpha subsp. ruderalis]BBN00865.1 hypothetical protein Mp_2g02780 [Marchantia polymorpha subsp. ruderalis]|eukprot:PTQ34918.1 hypothetical protein MARPO_0075s0039 [Marchantia polymorpha]